MNAHRERGLQLWHVRRYDLAAAEFRAALALEPNDSTTHALLASCLLEQKKHFEAEHHARTGVGCNADDPYAFYTLARVHRARGNHRDAFQMIAEAIRLAPHDADYHYFRGALFHDTDRHRESLRAAEAALGEDPQHVHAANLRLLNWQALEEFDQIDREIDRVLALDPEFAWSHENKGWSALRRGKRGDALYHFREALRLNPNRPSPKRGLILAIQARNPLCRFLNWLLQADASGRVMLGRCVLWIGLSGGLGWLTNPETPLLRAGTMALLLLFFWWLAQYLFAWLGEPFYLFLMRFDPLGKAHLTREERHAADAAACAGIGGAAALAAAIGFDQPVLYVAAFALFALPFPMHFVLRQRTLKNRLLTLVDVVLAALLMLFSLLGLFAIPFAAVFGFAVFGWCYRLVQDRATARLGDAEE